MENKKEVKVGDIYIKGMDDTKLLLLIRSIRDNGRCDCWSVTSDIELNCRFDDRGYRNFLCMEYEFDEDATFLGECANMDEMIKEYDKVLFCKENNTRALMHLPLEMMFDK